MKFKAIGFDYGGVIYGLPGSVFMDGVAKVLEVSREDLQKKYFENNSKANIEKLGWNEFWQRICMSFDKSDKYADLLEFIKKHDRQQKLNEKVVNLIENLRSEGFKIGLLSNYAEGLRERLKQQNIEHLFDAIGISSEMGTMKPQPEAFFKFCEMLACKPEELIFIDDTKKSLETFEAVGYVPVLFNDYENLLNDLNEMGIAAK